MGDQPYDSSLDPYQPDGSVGTYDATLDPYPGGGSGSPSATTTTSSGGGGVGLDSVLKQIGQISSTGGSLYNNVANALRGQPAANSNPAGAAANRPGGAAGGTTQHWLIYGAIAAVVLILGIVLLRKR